MSHWKPVFNKFTVYISITCDRKKSRSSRVVLLKLRPITRFRNLYCCQCTLTIISVLKPFSELQNENLSFNQKLFLLAPAKQYAENHSRQFTPCRSSRSTASRALRWRRTFHATYVNTPVWLHSSSLLRFAPNLLDSAQREKVLH